MAELLLDLGEAVTIASLGWALVELMLWLVAVALIALAIVFARILLWPLRQFVHLVSLGTVSDVPGEHAVAQFLTNALGSAAHGVDASAGRFWNGISTIISQVAEFVFGVSVLLAYLFYWVYIKYPLHVIEQVGRQALKLVHAITHRIAALEKDIPNLRKLVANLPATVIPRLGRLEHDVTVTIPLDIKTARELAKGAEQTAENAWNLVKSKPWEITSVAFAGAVAVALSTLGLGWLRCPGFTKFFRKTGCGLGNLLELLAGDVFLALAVSDLCAFAHGAEKVAKELEPALLTLVDVADALVGCHGASKPPPLGVATLPTLLTGSGLKLAS